MKEKHINEWPVLSASEVLKHSQPDDLWMIVFGKVYNATPLLQIHPGGAEVLIDCGGVDATDAFIDVGHSQDAVDMLKPYQVGVIERNERPTPTNHNPTKKPSRKYSISQKSPSQYSRKRLAGLNPEGNRRRLSVILYSFIACIALTLIVVLQRQQWIRIIT